MDLLPFFGLKRETRRDMPMDNEQVTTMKSLDEHLLMCS